MNSATKFFLILLRLAIGWHLLFAGLAKFESDYKGSEGYLQNAGGPAAPLFHRMIGDRLADKLAVDPDSAKEPHDRFPPVLAAEWNDYFDAFAAHYNLDAEQRQKAQDKINKIKDAAVKWMTTEEVTIKKPSSYGPPAEIGNTVPEWVKEYQTKRQKLRDEAAGQYHFSVSPATLADNTRDQSADKADVTRIRGELTQNLDKYKQEMKEALHSVLTDEQKKQPSLAEPIKPSWQHMTRMDWIDFLVRWGLTIIGAGLLLGFLTRLNCVAGAILLLSFYLAVPPLPGLPEAFRAEGYPYINKNIIEMLALLTLATTRSGRWAGIDGLLYYLNPFRRKTPEPRQVVPGRIETFTPYQVTTKG
jgi:uncharacterized membrane protein YphA (DoxX/SURF4 family)